MSFATYVMHNEHTYIHDIQPGSPPQYIYERGDKPDLVISGEGVEGWYRTGARA